MSNISIVAVVEDLFFTVKIQDAAKRCGLSCVFVKSAEKAIEKAKEQPKLIIIDLNAAAVAPLDLIRTLKGDPETSQISLLGYVSHVQADLKLEAQEAGCDAVLARSAFSQNLPQILKRHADAA
jgi:CheY-like chemotaxis protein